MYLCIFSLNAILFLQEERTETCEKVMKHFLLRRYEMLSKPSALSLEGKCGVPLKNTVQPPERFSAEWLVIRQVNLSFSFSPLQERIIPSAVTSEG